MIRRLIDRLRSLPRGDLLGPPVAYRPARTAIFAWRPSRIDPSNRVVPWTLRPLAANQQATCTLLKGPDADAAGRLAASEPSGAYWRSGPHLYAVTFRPLLPDEPDCAAVTR